MRNRGPVRIIIYIIVALAVIALVWFGMRASKPVDLGASGDTSGDQGTAAPITYMTIDITAPKGKVSAMIATSTEAQELGLGERDSLSKESGMLFVFPKAGVFGFWMKGMNFPLDIVWIDADKRVVGVAPGVRADSYPDVFYPPSPISYVLELNATAAQNFGIATGTQLVF